MTDNGTHVDVWLKGVGRRFVESLMGKSDRNVKIRIKQLRQTLLISSLQVELPVSRLELEGE
jgi:hypothetical protein